MSKSVYIILFYFDLKKPNPASIPLNKIVSSSLNKKLDPSDEQSNILKLSKLAKMKAAAAANYEDSAATTYHLKNKKQKQQLAEEMRKLKRHGNKLHHHSSSASTSPDHTDDNNNNNNGVSHLDSKRISNQVWLDFEITTYLKSNRPFSLSISSILSQVFKSN